MCKLYTLYSNTQYTTFTKYYKADLRRVADDNIYSAYLIRKASQNRINVLQVDRVAVHTAYGITWRRGEEWGECQPKMVSIELILPQCMHTFMKIPSDGHRRAGDDPSNYDRLSVRGGGGGGWVVLLEGTSRVRAGIDEGTQRAKLSLDEGTGRYDAQSLEGARGETNSKLELGQIDPYGRTTE